MNVLWKEVKSYLGWMVVALLFGAGLSAGHVLVLTLYRWIMEG